uniref:Uncharacterized protein n=1 Tax=Romanomermis culicivorax TaxID=13658 RepID=A0A915J4U0_ROMCU
MKKKQPRKKDNGRRRTFKSSSEIDAKIQKSNRTPTRNRLNDDIVEKLLFVKYYLAIVELEILKKSMRTKKTSSALPIKNSQLYFSFERALTRASNMADSFSSTPITFRT